MRLNQNASCFLVLAGLLLSGSALALPKATGHINIRDGASLPDIYSFNAQKDRNGAVKGQAQILLQPEGQRLHIDVQCLEVHGNRAAIGGTVRIVQDEGNSTPFPVGTFVNFLVQDNGEGNGNQDAGAPVLQGGCNLYRGADASEAGNVQVSE